MLRDQSALVARARVQISMALECWPAHASSRAWVNNSLSFSWERLDAVRDEILALTGFLKVFGFPADLTALLTVGDFFAIPVTPHSSDGYKSIMLPAKVKVKVNYDFQQFRQYD